jgi:hypothetical protein
MISKIITLFFYLFLTLSIESFAQIDEKELYKKAYNYLNDSIVKLKHPSIKDEIANIDGCSFYAKGYEFNFDSELQVANRFIENNLGFPYTNFMIKKYKLSKKCIKALKNGKVKCELINRVKDSLALFWKEYKMKDTSEISKLVKDLKSLRKDGYQVFFSDIYKNALLAEVKSFCFPYDKGIWLGMSTFFYLIFSDKGEIEEIYYGKTIAYN